MTPSNSTLTSSCPFLVIPTQTNTRIPSPTCHTLSSSESGTSQRGSSSCQMGSQRVSPCLFQSMFETLFDIRRFSESRFLDCTRAFLISRRCVYDGSSTRWNNTPTPNPLSCIHIFGLCHSITPSGLLSVHLDAITLNLSPQVLNSASPSNPSQSPQSPNKRRKFQTHASGNALLSPT